MNPRRSSGIRHFPDQRAVNANEHLPEPRVSQFREVFSLNDCVLFRSYTFMLNRKAAASSTSRSRQRATAPNAKAKAVPSLAAFCHFQ